MPKIETVNEVHASGKVIGTGKNSKGYSTITMVIKGRKNAIIRFVVDNLSAGIRTGDYVEIHGFTRAYAYKNDAQDRWISVQEFVGVDVKKLVDTELMEKFGVQGRHFRDPYFRAYIKGEVTGILDINDKWGKLTIKTSGQGIDQRPSYIVLSYQKSRWLPAFNYNRGDVVCLSASVSTPEKELNGRTVYFENLIIEDIVRTYEASPDEKEVKPAQRKTEIDMNTVVNEEDSFVQDDFDEMS